MTYAGLLVCGAILTALLAYPVRAFASRIGAIAYPGGRSIHKEPTPLMGGLAIFFSCVILFVLIALVREKSIWTTLRSNPWKLCGLLVGSTTIVILGCFDDLYRLSARVKLMGQFCAASSLLLFGFKVSAVSLPFLGTFQLGVLGYLVFIVWVVGITNAVNLIDGVDGLASTACLMTALGSGVIAIQMGNVFIAFFCFMIAGCLLGFLFHNFPPARIFLGDTGSMLLGFMLAVIVLESHMFVAQKRSILLMLAGPLLLLGFSLLDVIIAVIRRFLRGKPIFAADVGHLHHRLMVHFKNPRRVLLVVGGFSAVNATAAVILNSTPSTAPRFWVVSAVVFLCFLFFLHLLGYFRVQSLGLVLGQRTEVKFFYAFLSYMGQRLPKAKSREELFENIELACKDLGIENLKILDGRKEPVFRWVATRGGPVSELVTEQENFRKCGVQVLWSIRPSDEEGLQHEIQLVMKQFLQMLSEHWARIMPPQKKPLRTREQLATLS